MIPGDLLSAFPHRQFHTLPGLPDSRAALPNSNPNACMPMQGGSLCHFYDGLWYDPAERRTHDLSCERRTRCRLSQPDTVKVPVLIRGMETKRVSILVFIGVKLQLKSILIFFLNSQVKTSSWFLCICIILSGFKIIMESIYPFKFDSAYLFYKLTLILYFRWVFFIYYCSFYNV